MVAASTALPTARSRPAGDSCGSGAPLVHAPLQLLVLALVLPAVTLRVRLLFPLLLLLLLLLLLRLRRRCDGAGLAANPIFTALRR